MFARFCIFFSAILRLNQYLWMKVLYFVYNIKWKLRFLGQIFCPPIPFFYYYYTKKMNDTNTHLNSCQYIIRGYVPPWIGNKPTCLFSLIRFLFFWSGLASSSTSFPCPLRHVVIIIIIHFVATPIYIHTSSWM